MIETYTYSHGFLCITFDIDDDIHIDIWNCCVDFIEHHCDSAIILANNDDDSLRIACITLSESIALLNSCSDELMFIQSLDNDL